MNPHAIHPSIPPMAPVDWIPVGSVLAFAGEIAASPAPDSAGDHATEIEAWGWMICDGRELEVSAYPHLFAVLGFRYGGNGDDRFKIPDYRGYFHRGVDGGSGNDPDVSQRTAPEGGTGKPEEVGSLQEDALQTHEHNYKTAPAPAAPSNSGTASGAAGSATALTEKGPVDGPGAATAVKVSENESRPKNIYVCYIMKYAYLSRRCHHVSDA